MILCEGTSLVNRHRPQVVQVVHQQEDIVAVSMVPQLLQPVLHILVCHVLGDVIYQQRTQRAMVVCRGGGTVLLLAGSVPDLPLDHLAIHLNAVGGKLHAYGALALQAELLVS